MLIFKKIILISTYLLITNAHGSIIDDSSPFDQAVFLLGAKQSSKQISKLILLEESSRPSARKLNHRKRRNRKKQLVSRAMQSFGQLQQYHHLQDRFGTVLTRPRSVVSNRHNNLI